ncbi:MAG: hypothetical protein HC857_02645 [Synechococcales cyanobacterium RU_4_20]|nr:hypothetical protein [Synechococcales cyanobacterium RU_4_20]NJR69953.1 hypothetical protein [Synechococcales cyanobacterium CRU_2_2]
MSITHLRLRNRRFWSSHLAIAVFPSASTAFMAYRLLHYHGISPENLALVGNGYSKPESVGLTESSALTRQRAKACAFVGCVLSSAIAFAMVGLFHTDFGLALAAALVLLVPISAMVGSLAGAGLGWLLGCWGEVGRLSIYRHHLRQGHYLLMIEGSEKTVLLSQEVLGQYATPKT